MALSTILLTIQKMYNFYTPSVRMVFVYKQKEQAGIREYRTREENKKIAESVDVLLLRLHAFHHQGADGVVRRLLT
jgi:hypothetical protein